MLPPGTRTMLNNPWWVVTVCIAAGWTVSRAECWAKGVLARRREIRDIHIMLCDDDSMTVIAQVQGPSPLFALNRIESLWENELIEELEVKPLGLPPALPDGSGVTVHASADPYPDSV